MKNNKTVDFNQLERTVSKASEDIDIVIARKALVGIRKYDKPFYTYIHAMLLATNTHDKIYGIHFFTNYLENNQKKSSWDEQVEYAKKGKSYLESLVNTKLLINSKDEKRHVDRVGWVPITAIYDSKGKRLTHNLYYGISKNNRKKLEAYHHNFEYAIDDLEYRFENLLGEDKRKNLELLKLSDFKDGVIEEF